MGRANRRRKRARGARARAWAADDEERLWGSLAVGAQQSAWRHGTLGPGSSAEPVPVFVIFDLARLSLAASRACVSLIGADVAHLERHGHSVAWVPRAYWLAACAARDVGKISPHLLDRFALRISAARAPARDRVHAILTAVGHTSGRAEVVVRDMVGAVAQARDQRAALSAAALDDVCIGTRGEDGHRRALVLGRLAVAQARLEGAVVGVPAHVTAARDLLGLAASDVAPIVPQQAEVAAPDGADPGQAIAAPTRLGRVSPHRVRGPPSRTDPFTCRTSRAHWMAPSS